VLAYLAVCLSALLVAALTLFSGFGLGTLLLPAFALFFPVEVAVAATAVVHFLNNLFKLVLVGRNANARIALIFGLPGVALSFLGAWVLTAVADLPAIRSYPLGGQQHDITLVKIVIGALMVVFAFLDLAPAFRKLQFGRQWLPVGGALSGFFGGISGHQGALRAAFLAKVGLTPRTFIATNVVCAVMVDTARLSVYGAAFFGGHVVAVKQAGLGGLIIAGTLSAFVGSYLGARLSRTMTLESLHLIVGVMLIGIGVALATGLI
jgi:uncharacterized membrane protein YfcA